MLNQLILARGYLLAPVLSPAGHRSVTPSHFNWQFGAALARAVQKLFRR